ncbi:MAG: lipid-binding SYLF domain-containing protein [Firmicutes bacterium]|nr:lipid-binding SYLF domain-containing protein [Bacillota bacterium]
MKKILFLLLSLIVLTTGSVVASQLPDELLADATETLKQMAEQPDSEQLHSMLRDAHGVAIFPSLIRAGLGFGGRYGEGVVLRYNSSTETWYGPYFVTMKGLSYGFQIGVQSTALVLVMATEEGMDSVKEGRITLGGNLSIAAGPVGRSAEASTDVKLEAAMYSYSMSKGAFVGASLEGASIDNNVNANQVYWKKTFTPAEILQKKAKGSEVKDLLAELNRIIGK